MAPTTLIKLVDFHLVNLTENRCLAQFYVFAALSNDGWLSILRVGIPKHTQILHYNANTNNIITLLSDLTQSYTTYIPKCIIEL